jgi:putative addiction module killer protein
MVRIQGVASGNFGDYKQPSDSVCELRIDDGPGYRVYYARVGSKLIFLLVVVTSESSSPILRLPLPI